RGGPAVRHDVDLSRSSLGRWEHRAGSCGGGLRTDVGVSMVSGIVRRGRSGAVHPGDNAAETVAGGVSGRFADMGLAAANCGGPAVARGGAVGGKGTPER